MRENFSLPKLLGVSALSLMLIASSAMAQSTSSGSTMSDKNTSSSSAGASAGDTSKSGSTSGRAAGQVDDQDKEMMEDIAHGNLAEIETGKMALEKSQDPQVKKFAQTLIDDHTKAMKELQSLAKKKGVELPTETDLQHKTIATALKALSGNTFDEQFIKRVGVGDHERTLDLLKKTEKEAKDKDLKAYAAKTIKPVSKHLEQARKMEKKSEMKSESKK